MVRANIYTIGMRDSQTGETAELLVVTADRSFGSMVVDAVEKTGERTGTVASADLLNPAVSELPRRDPDRVEGAIVDGQLAEPAAVVEQLVKQAGLSVVTLVDSSASESENTIDRVLAAGATDIFPRTAASTQCELVIARLVAGSSSTGGQALAAQGATHKEAYKTLFEKISEGLVVHDPETGVILEVNERFCAMNGYDREELIGESIDIVTPADEAYGREAANEMIQRARTEGPQRFEWHNQRRNGEVFPVEVDLTVVKLNGRERVLASVQNITERRRREREYEQIFNKVNAAITVHDPAARSMVDVNDTMAEWTGYDREELIAGGVALFSATEQGFTPDRAYQAIEQAADSGEDQTVEWQIETVNGEYRWFGARATTATIGGKQRVLGISQDITERKRREQEYEQMFNKVNDAIVVFDPEGEIIEVNDAYRKLLGYSLEEIRELGIAGLSANEEGYTGDRGWELIQGVARTGESEAVEWKAETSNGTQIWLAVTLTPAEIGGKQRVLSIQRDVTERKRREQRLEVFNRILRHNLRNQLEVIRSHAEELATRAGDDHADQITAAVDELAATGSQAREADQLLATDADPTPVAVGELLRAVIDCQAVDTGTTVQADLAEITVVTHKQLLETAVQQAVENAVEHAHSRVVVTAARSDAGCEIAIEDDGEGIQHRSCDRSRAGPRPSSHTAAGSVCGSSGGASMSSAVSSPSIRPTARPSPSPFPTRRPPSPN
jgi:PAS domain S-box